MSYTEFVIPIVIVISLIILESLCGDATGNRNPWPQLPNQNQQYQPVVPQWGPAKQTTPWPSLGGQRIYNSYNNYYNSNTSRTWNRPSHNSAGSSFTNQENNNYPRQNSNFNQNSNGGEVNDDDLRSFSENLLNKDQNNAARYVNVNFQGKTTSRSPRDEAPMPLLSIDQQAYNIPSIEKMVRLYDNYVLETNVAEQYTNQERNEEDNLINFIVNTPVMEHTRDFLAQKGHISGDLNEFVNILKEIWFTMYTRGGRKVSSSGFEHIFLAEIKNNQVSGLHNWIYFNEEEKHNRANYLGYLKKVDLGNKGAIVKYHFTFKGIDKPVGSMFIGTSPELEMALYTTCFLLRADHVCPLKLNGNRFVIRTFTYRYKGKNLIGSAFPEI